MSEPYKTTSTVKPAQVFFKKTIDKTKKFLLKTLENLKSFLFRGYKSAHKLPQSRPFFPSGVNRISDSAIKELNDLYRSWSQQWESEKTESGKEASVGDGECVIGIQKNVKRRKVGEEERRCDEAKRREAFSQSSRRSLAKKMEELEMMDMEDVDQVLDIQQVLHYYSLLNCPLYLDIVDTFFMDMYTEFSFPPPTISRVNSSMRSLGPIKL